MNIVLDTQVLIYAVEDAKKPEHIEIYRRAHFYIEEMGREKHTIMLPSVVAGEFFAGYSCEERKREALETIEQFIILPFDARAAHVYGSIYHSRVLQAMNHKDDRSKGAKRTKLCVDCQVVATALSWKADCIISNDKDLKMLGEGLIKVSEVPRLPEQKQLEMPEQA